MILSNEEELIIMGSFNTNFEELSVIATSLFVNVKRVDNKFTKKQFLKHLSKNIDIYYDSVKNEVEGSNND